MQCLQNIFPAPSPRVKFLIAFGDNDVGGEGRDRMTDRVLGYVRELIVGSNNFIREIS